MIEKLPPKFDKFPQRENCDPNDPYQAFLWMLVALPGQNGGPLVMPIDYLQLVSKRLWDLGCRQVAEPTLEWMAPTGSEPRWMTTPGKWVPAGSIPKPTEEQAAKLAVSKMTMQQKAELLEALEAWDLGIEVRETPAALVSQTLSNDQKRVVLAVLRSERDAT